MKSTTCILSLFALFIGVSSSYSLALPQSEFTMAFRAPEVIFIDDSTVEVPLAVGSNMGIDIETPTGRAVGRWSEGNDEHATELGIARVLNVQPENCRISVHLSAPEMDHGYLYAGDLLFLPVRAQISSYQGVLRDLALQSIGLTDIHEAFFYQLSQLTTSEKEEIESPVFMKMMEDIRFVAQEMRNQMDEPEVEGGRFDGEGLFDAMEQSQESDLRDFLHYLRQRPRKYRGTDWKLSEIFATWIVNKAPAPQELEIDWVLNEQQTDRTSRQTSSDCGGKALFLDLKKGNISGLKPTASFETIKSELTCFTGETEEGADHNCGGGIYYLKHGFFFYSHQDYIEVRGDYSGGISQDLLGKSKDEILDALGKPDRIPTYQSDSDLSWYQPDVHYLYKQSYGSLRITFEPENMTCTIIAVHGKKPEEIEICW